MHKWVEQQQQLQRAGAWEVRTISARAGNRNLAARLYRANEDRRAAESRLADVTKERDRLVARVKTLERGDGAQGKATGTGRGGAGGCRGPPG